MSAVILLLAHGPWLLCPMEIIPMISALSLFVLLWPWGKKKGTLPDP